MGEVEEMRKENRERTTVVFGICVDGRKVAAVNESIFIAIAIIGNITGSITPSRQ